MRRILVAWELGLNLGHLARLLPICESLKARGHAVLSVVRDLKSTASVFGPAQITFAQAPVLLEPFSLGYRPAGYADILLSQGWQDADCLGGLLEGWISLFRMFRPDVVVADFSPTACLAAYALKIKVVCVGSGFEIPPSTFPLEPFPGFSWATAKGAAKSEALALANAQIALARYRARPLTELRLLFDQGLKLFATFPEMDHYAKRPGERYVGLIRGQPRGETMRWLSESYASRIFAYLRSDTPLVGEIIEALFQSGHDVVCVAPGVSKDLIPKERRHGFRFLERPADLTQLLHMADLCVSYGPEGTVVQFLLAGCPQLISPKLVEAFLTARRVVQLGCGIQLSPTATCKDILDQINELLTVPKFKAKARAFREAHVEYSLEKAVEQVVDQVLSC